jgi:uncharacterized protein
MLIEFQVENFRSFRERQVLSIVAAHFPEHLAANTFDSGLKGFDRLLRASVIYGPNAAGKTNLVRAIKFVKDFVIGSATSAVGAYQYTPFKLASTSRKRASEFQIAFVQNGTRYEYNFSMGPTQIEREWLIEYVHVGVRARGRTMFERTWDNRKKQYIWAFSSFLKGQRSVWSDSTRPDALFLSTAIQLNSIQLRPVFEWFQKRLVVIAGEIRLNESMTIKLLEESNAKDRLLPFLQEADLGIADLKVKQEPLPSSGRVIVGRPGIMLSQKTPDSALNVVTVTLSHSSDDPKALVGLDFDEESSGTQILFKTAGAWLNVFANGEVLLFDEIDTNMHPKLLRFLIRKFYSSKENPHNAQLVCSTHNTSLLDQELFRRDQIWFVEKGKDGSSKLYPLTDFSPRNDEVLERWYMRGRYGAVPILPESTV